MENGKPNKRLTLDRGYKRPEKTYQDKLTNQEIKEKLKEYKKCANIRHVSIGTHIRYFSVDPNTKEKIFRLGGTLNKIDDEGRFVILGNGKISWSVQIPGTQFWQKLSESEYKEEIKKEIRNELMSEIPNENKEIKNELEKENKELKKEIKNLLKKNELLQTQITKITMEINKKKNKL